MTTYCVVMNKNGQKNSTRGGSGAIFLQDDIPESELDPYSSSSGNERGSLAHFLRGKDDNERVGSVGYYMCENFLMTARTIP